MDNGRELGVWAVRFSGDGEVEAYGTWRWADIVLTLYT